MVKVGLKFEFELMKDIPQVALMDKLWDVLCEYMYHKVSNIRRTKFQNLNASRLIL